MNPLRNQDDGSLCSLDQKSIKELLSIIPRDKRFTPEFFAEISVITEEDEREMAKEEDEIRSDAKKQAVT